LAPKLPVPVAIKLFVPKLATLTLPLKLAVLPVKSNAKFI
jgi:hypothetical protein